MPSWNDFGKAALSISRTLGLYGWDSDVAAEYTRMVEGKCPVGRAITELRRVASEGSRLASASEIVTAAKEKSSGDRWITVSYDVYGHGRRTGARRIPNDGSHAAGYVRPGETLVADTAENVNGNRVHWSKCEEGLQFHEMLGKMGGKRGKEGFSEVGKVLENATK